MIELPPYETNGKVTPAMGIIPIFMPILTNIWKNNIVIVPIKSIFSFISDDRCDRIITLINIIK